MFGVTTATVSSWLERGVLGGVRITHVWHIDKDSVDAVRDRLVALGEMERNAEALKKELAAVTSERKNIIVSARRDNGVLRHIPSFVELVGTFADIMSIDDKYNARYVLLSFVGGVPTSDIAEELGVSTARVRQILYASFKRMGDMPKYRELQTELKESNKRIEDARIRINGLKSAVSAYEESDKSITRGVGEITIARTFLVPIGELGFPKRAVNGLVKCGVMVNGRQRTPKNLGQLVQISDTDIYHVRTLGKKSLYEISERLGEMGLRLGMSIDNIVEWSRGASELVNVVKNDIDFHRI